MTTTSTDATHRLAVLAQDLRWEDIPEDVRHEAKRSLLNYIGVAIAGCREPAVEKSLSVFNRFSGTATAGIIGRAERVDMLLAAYTNAISANIFDYDDTHQPTVIHPAAPVAPALFAYAETEGCDGASLLHAFVLGGEVECRIGNAVSPYHYGHGWHITSTCGVFGAAMGGGALLGLDAERFAWALGNASAQASGLVENLGTMAKSISVGNAARNGLAAALLAAEGFSGPASALEGVHGFLPVFSDSPNMDALFNGWGESWEIARNTYKPYPAGIVLHPVIEACLELHAAGGFTVDDIAEVELTGPTLLRQRTDRPNLASGRESQVSAQHAVPTVLRLGEAGLAAFSDAAVTASASDRSRIVFSFVDDDRYDIESARVEIRTRQGERFDLTVENAKGGARNPMTDAALEEKLAMLADWRGVVLDIPALTEAVWTLDKAPDAAEVMRLATAGGGSK